MAPVARELASVCGVLEPLQKAESLDGQVEELRSVLAAHAALPVILIGYSWGAWLSFILAARYPALVRKLILVGSGAFEESYVAQLMANRLSHLTAAEGQEFQTLVRELVEPDAPNKDAMLARLGLLASKADAYDPLSSGEPPAPLHGEIYQRVWPAAAAMRRSGELLDLGRSVRCPVVALHGDYDPSPAEGVRVPLAAVLSDFRFILLARCGHTPWRERQARVEFYEILREELRL
ncbi:MAG: alpha/beta hydrolase [Anaerolineae bacterium]|nr:alpha/beta hydrolase [Anaerolineae bacterium]